MSRTHLSCLVAAAVCSWSSASGAFGVFGTGEMADAMRWDAAPRMVDGFERSLDGGLRYSVEGGSFEAYRDRFVWRVTVPTPAEFQQAIEDAFAQWTGVDPATGLATPLEFVPDLATPTELAIVGDAYAGAEIDLTSMDLGFNPQTVGIDGLVMIGYLLEPPGGVKLTTGATGQNVPAFTGADIFMNDNPGAEWDLDTFETVLTHEIGHVLGLADVDVVSGPQGLFIDDDYDPSNSLTASQTLTNSFADQIDIFHPDTSPLDLYYVANGDPGFDSVGADILMERNIPYHLFLAEEKLQNDDFAGRQFLYPWVLPEPSGLVGLGAGALLIRALRRRRTGAAWVPR